MSRTLGVSFHCRWTGRLLFIGAVLFCQVVRVWGPVAGVLGRAGVAAGRGGRAGPRGRVHSIVGRKGGKRGSREAVVGLAG